MNAIWLLLGLLVLAYLGSGLVGGRAIRGFGLASGAEYLLLGFVLGPQISSALPRSLLETFEPVLLVECPRILFPFARNILSDVTRDGGFPPVLLQPIDFVALWQSRLEATGDRMPTAVRL